MQDRPSTLRRLLLLAASLFVGAIGWFMLGESEAVIAAEGNETVLVRVNGVTVTEREVLEAAQAELLKLDHQRYTVIQSYMHGKKREILLEQAAEKAGVTVEQYLQTEVQGKLQEVSDAEINAWYEKRKNLIRQPKERVEAQIRELLAREAMFQQLESTADIEILLEPFRVEVAAKGPTKGPAGAPVTIVEFSDFECPFCGRINPALKKVEEAYGDKVRIVFRQFPLDKHTKARKAGEASLCAAEQKTDFFWNLHDAMFADQANLDVASLKTKAAAIEGLDSAAFDECLDSGRYGDRVEEDLQAGKRVGVNGTPAIFVNGRLLAGVQEYEAIAAVIDDELRRAGAPGLMPAQPRS